MFSTSINFSAALCLAVMLFALFFAMRVIQQRQEELEEAKAEAEKELQEIGLEKEELRRNKPRAARKLLRHPDRVQRLQQIVEDVAMLEAA